MTLERAERSVVRILGIDPGSRLTGYGVIDCLGQKAEHVAHGRLRTVEGSLPERLLAIFQGLEAVIAEFQPQEVAIEETFVNRVNAASALVLGQARGAAVCVAARAGLPVAEYAATQVKLAVVGTGKADKQQVQHMVRTLLRVQGAFTADAADALAIALTHAHVRSSLRSAGAVWSRSWKR